MPPTGHRPLLPARDNRPRIIRRDQSNPINNNNNTPPPDLLYPIVQPSQPPPPTPFPTPDEVNNIISRNLRTINREARMKQNQLDREARKRQREESKKQTIVPVIPPQPVVPLIPPPPVVPVIPPLNNNFNSDNKNDIIIPPQGDFKFDDSTTLKPIKNDKNIYLIGGTALIAFLVIAMNKR